MRIGVLLSGGVDSSTALLLLRKSYPDAAISAYYLKIWLEDELAFLGTCPWEEDLSYAHAVCDIAKIPLRIISLQKEYWESVVSYTLAELKVGRTPSPDILCNRRIKFGAFLHRVGESLDRVASGHYAICTQGSGGVYYIRRSPDAVKDQTYFLSQLTQMQASMAVFPIGGMTKSEVRRMAADFNVPAKTRKDSQGICFLGGIKYRDFVRHYMGEKSGKILELETNRELGIHRGSWFYTIGQRTRLGLSDGPWYVVAKNHEENTVTIARGMNAQARACACFFTGRPNWISGPPRDTRVSLKLRHGSKIVSATIKNFGSEQGERLRVDMDEPDRGVAPGQFAVFYHEDVCLGGAMIAAMHE